MVWHYNSADFLHVRWRFIFAILGSMGMAIIYGLKVNLSVAIVSMIDHDHLEDEHDYVKHPADGFARPVHEEVEEWTCYNVSSDDTSGHAENGPFRWTSSQQGLVLGSYFWGYFITQIPGGRAAERFGGKWVFFVAVLLSVIPTLLSPVCSTLGYEYLIAMRVIEGLGGGFTFPAMNVLISRWSPKEERSSISSIVFGGTSLGTVISIPTSGLLAGSLGWESVFYVHGGLAVIWCVLWVILVADCPEEHKWISDEEKEFITGSHMKLEHHLNKKLKVPWKEILTSLPVWVIVVCHTLNNFAWYMLLVELPTFMRVGLGFNIKENAGLSCVPFLLNWLFSVVYSNRLDWARHKNYISTTNARKLSQAIATVLPAAGLIGVSLSGCDRTAVVIFMILSTGFFGSMFAGVFSNHCDIASNYAGLLMGMSNMAATIPGFAVPAIVGVMTHGKHGIEPWHIIFYVTAGLLVVEFFIFTFLASGVEQSWNRVHEIEHYMSSNRLSGLNMDDLQKERKSKKIEQ